MSSPKPPGSPTLPKELIVKPVPKVVHLRGETKRIRTNSKEFTGNGHWLFDKAMNPNDYVGFIYLIYDTRRGKMYIGKKQYKGTGSVNKGQETNWRWYSSSCTELSDNIRARGREDFLFYVIEEYRSKGGLSYAESWSLFHVQAPVFRDKWYNTLINKVSWAVKEPITKKHMFRLTEIVGNRGEELPAFGVDI